MLVHCDRCAATVDAVPLQSYSTGELDDAFVDRFLYEFARCPRCDSPFLFESEEGLGDGFDVTWIKQQRIFPVDVASTADRFPPPVRSSLEEAIRCRSAKAHTATAIMCRRTIEAVCATHGVRSNNLAGALHELREQGVIERRLFEWADYLRIAGNEAAHNVDESVSAQDANDMFDFTNALLEYVFTFRDRFEAFKKRRAGRSSAEPATGG